MWDIFQTKLFAILSKEASTEEMDIVLKTAYREFVEKLINYLDNEYDNIKRIRMLNLIYIEFDMIKALEISYGAKKDVLKIIYSDKILSFVSKESDLIYRQMEYPKYFINIEATWKSPLFLNPNVVNLVDVMENICGYYYMNGVTTRDGTKISLNLLTRTFEKFFNLKIPDVYKKRDEVIQRKSNKLTGFLDRMRTAIIRESKNQGYTT